MIDSSFIRVACVGDSITYGAGLAEPGRESYPAILGKLLGGQFEVGNFGVNNATVLRRGNHPIWDQPAFRAATAFLPALVLILLGSNDSKLRNWRERREIETDLRSLHDHFRNLEPQPSVWFCLPPPMFGVRRIVQGHLFTFRVLPAIRRVADERGAPLVDLNSPLSQRRDLFPDGIHPNAAGAALIAETVCRRLTEEGVCD